MRRLRRLLEESLHFLRAVPASLEIWEIISTSPFVLAVLPAVHASVHGSF